MSSRILAHIRPDRFETLENIINSYPDFQAVASNIVCTFSIASSENDQSSVLVTIENGRISLRTGIASQAVFGLQARPEDWDSFFSQHLVRPYQSFWGILRVLGHEEGVAVLGDTSSFGKHAQLWRIVLDRAREAAHGLSVGSGVPDLPVGEFQEEDAITGKYTWISHSSFGKCKVFYEFSGHGSTPIVFLHTAGSDSRQYHSIMNNLHLQDKLTMYAFDLPAHGRSSLGTMQSPGPTSYALTEEAYIETIVLVLERLKLGPKPILCGASMAGHVCLAVAIHASDPKHQLYQRIAGTIPCEGCAHLPFTQPIYEIGGADSSLLDPERVIGMCAPGSPEYFRRQIWWQYSTQGLGIFSGDLKFYFRGWDGRNRLETIDSAICPVYMLTGEYDYSCTVTESQAAANMIKGAQFEAMKGLGHFPLTENPDLVLPYLTRAIDWIVKQNEQISG